MFGCSLIIAYPWPIYLESKCILNSIMAKCSLLQRVELLTISKKIERDEVLEVEHAIYPVDSTRANKWVIGTKGRDYVKCVSVLSLVCTINSHYG